MFFNHWMQIRVDSAEQYLEKNGGTSLKGFEAISRNDANWILSLLVHLDEVITGDMTSLLRTTCRACVSLMKLSLTSMDNSSVIVGNDPLEIDQGRAYCWMIITAVVRCWYQRDLWDEAVSSLVR